ncbi:hypothetical protein SDC9_72271 [bioreactor metagenome]|uniref:Uncharacterized protein n=1 Tax=bioreactor metagenome TaxID=1076179 RepID=A0A644YD09_9ZZZZ
MKKIFKLQSCVLVVCLLFVSVFSNSVYANTAEIESDIVTIDNTKYKIERTISDSAVNVTLKEVNGDTLCTAVNNENGLYLNGELISEKATDETNSTLMKAIPRAALKWGPWSTSNITVKTGGMNAALVAGAIAAAAPWVSLSVIGGMSATIAASYSKVVIKMQIRYAKDSKYQYYQRKTSFYGNGTSKFGPTLNEDRKVPLYK